MNVTDPKGREARVLHGLVDFTGKDVLEIGAGDGRLTWRYADRARSVRALDVKADAIERARATTPRGLRGRVRFEARDVTQTRLRPRGYDVVVLSYSL